jgi:AraC family ethanolamine operon transcriptional activator
MNRPSNMQGLEDYDLVTLGAALGLCEVDLLTLSPARPRASVASKAHDGVTYLTGHIDFDVRGSLTVPDDACMLVYLHETGERSWCQGVSVESEMGVTLLRGTPTDFMFALCALPLALHGIRPCRRRHGGPTAASVLGDLGTSQTRLPADTRARA